MKEQVKDILRPFKLASRYAADCIEELEAEREKLRGACEAALDDIGTNIMGESCNPELEAMLCAALGKPGKVAKRGCRHAISNYQLDGDTGHVWCFACKPPRRIT